MAPRYGETGRENPSSPRIESYNFSTVLWLSPESIEDLRRLNVYAAEGVDNDEALTTRSSTDRPPAWRFAPMVVAGYLGTLGTGISLKSISSESHGCEPSERCRSRIR